ncbi:MAG: 2-keto-3-deoxy-galactonokinase [Alphaproteobacteria bacterium]|jgi:2-dehydro-3-deoxygalactonokinase|nr:2-keto-3-deoxy-galactonokinase [Alphaproteobacteria bacterium]
MNIFADWGNTNFRAFLVKNGQVVERYQSAEGGIQKVFTAPENRVADYSGFFTKHLADWLQRYPQASIHIAGAAGGRDGWVETSYSIAPAGLADVKRNLHRIAPEHLGAAAGREIYIASGCTIAMADGRHDVIRSEEVKSLGAARHLKRSAMLMCIPGTHCKWVKIEDDKIVHFESALTGELYGILSERGALAALFRFDKNSQQKDMGSFDLGLELAGRGFDLLTDLWQVRAQKLRATPHPADMQAYFSGILIGHELRQMDRLFPGKPPVVLLMDGGAKREFYARAFDWMGWKIDCDVDSETAVVSGLLGVI